MTSVMIRYDAYFVETLAEIAAKLRFSTCRTPNLYMQLIQSIQEMSTKILTVFIRT